MYILLAGGCSFFREPGGGLVSIDGGDAPGSGHFHAQVAWVNSCAKLVGDTSAEHSVVVVWDVDHVEGNVLGSGDALVAEGYWKRDFAYCSYLLTPEAEQGMSGRLELVSVKLHSIEGGGEKDVGGAAVVHEYFCYCPASDVGFNDHGVGVWVLLQLEIGAVEGDWDVGPLGVFVGAFCGHVVDAPEVLPPLPLVAVVFIGSSGDGQDYTEGGGRVIDCHQGHLWFGLGLDLLGAGSARRGGGGGRACVWAG